jgi:phosphoglycerate dehydrogenase-like enzyme
MALVENSMISSMPRTSASPNGGTMLVFEPVEKDLNVYVQRLQSAFPSLRVVAARTREEAERSAPLATIMAVRPILLDRNIVALAPQLRWIQSLISGVDMLAGLGIRPETIITATRGIHGPQMAELGIMLMMAVARRFPQLIRNQDQHAWIQWQQALLFEKHVVILGLGSVGEMLAKLCNAFGMKVSGVSDGRKAVEGIIEIFPRARIRDAVAAADFVVSLIPNATDTNHIVNREVFEAMNLPPFSSISGAEASSTRTPSSRPSRTGQSRVRLWTSSPSNPCRPTALSGAFRTW